MFTHLYFIKDVPSGVPVSPVIACSSELAALHGFSNFLKNQTNMDPRCYCLRRIPVILDDDFNVESCELGASTLVCRGDDVDVCVTNALNNLSFEE